jgi:hypothetical protein
MHVRMPNMPFVQKQNEQKKKYTNQKTFVFLSPLSQNNAINKKIRKMCPKLLSDAVM